jgi:glutamyl-tRNA synthetase
MEIKVRFAPSPTGNIHIGNIRTAIFNWLFARHNGGKFFLRVEDTDKERSTQRAINKMLDCMIWLGLDYDEDIYYQSRHEAEHKNAAEQLVREGKAYYKPAPDGDKSPIVFRIPWDTEKCFCIRSVGEFEYSTHTDVPIEIDSTGVKFAQVSKKGKPVESAGCLAGFRNMKVFDKNSNVVFELEKNVEDILSGNKSFKLENCEKISFLRHEVFFRDLIKGELAKPLDSVKDLIIARSDGSPVFHLANVCDDAEQSVTHIIRGDDHVENTYRHILLFYSLGFDIPKYAHMPMIINKVGKPYSKRDGDAFVGDFQSKGFLPDALFNYLSLLGWSPGDDREKMTRQEMIEAFTLERVKSSPAQFDVNKLLNMNGMYTAELSRIRFLQTVYDEVIKQGWGDSITSTALFEDVAELFQSRTKLFSQVEDWKYFFFDDSPLFNREMEQTVEISSPAFGYDTKTLKKALSKEGVKKGIVQFCDSLEKTQVFSIETIINLIHEAESSVGLQEGKLNQGLRISLTGKTSGAGLHETIKIIGKERVELRLKKVLEAVNEI